MISHQCITDSSNGILNVFPPSFDWCLYWRVNFTAAGFTIIRKLFPNKYSAVFHAIYELVQRGRGGGSDFPTDSPAHQYALRTGPTCGSRLEAGSTRRWKINHVHFAIHSNHIVTDGRMARTATKPTHSCGGVSWPIHGKPVGVGLGVRAWPNLARACRLFIFNQQTAKGVNADQTNKVIRFFAATSLKFLLVWHPSSPRMHYAKGYCVIGAKIGVVLLWNLTIFLNFSLQK